MARIATQLRDVLTAAKELLIARGIFTDSQCFLATDPFDIVVEAKQTPPLAAVTFMAYDQFPETIHCEIDPDDTPAQFGALTIAVWIRIGIDPPGGDDVAITSTEAPSGISPLVRQIVAALNNRELIDSDGDYLLWRSLNYIGFSNRGKWRQDPRWRRFDVRFDCCWMLEPNDPDESADLLYGDSDEALIYGDSATEPLVWMANG